jgi:hypothetical protein
MSDDPVDETPSRGIMTTPNRASGKVKWSLWQWMYLAVQRLIDDLQLAVRSEAPRG